jgi:hypothetical protein
MLETEGGRFLKLPQRERRPRYLFVARAMRYAHYG